MWSVCVITRHQTHPLRCLWGQALSSESDCRGRWSLWCSSCTQTPPGPCTVCGSSSRSLRNPTEFTKCQNGNSWSYDIVKPTSYLHYLFCKCSSQSLHAYRKASNQLTYLLKDGGGGKLWFWLQTVTFFHVLQVSASCVQHRKTTSYPLKLASLYLLPHEKLREPLLNFKHDTD